MSTFFKETYWIWQPQNHDWRYDNDQLAIDWMTISLAPESILELLFSVCIKSCDNNRRVCSGNSIPSTDMGKLKNCWISVTIKESDGEDEEDSDSEISDDSDEDEI